IAAEELAVSVLSRPPTGCPPPRPPAGASPIREAPEPPGRRERVTTERRASASSLGTVLISVIGTLKL
uniref:Uncharacterized protein n=1 Tax=Leersia perrieri TaxID=77586 RepID=A0A0D9X4N2_9ORYZ